MVFSNEDLHHARHHCWLISQEPMTECGERLSLSKLHARACQQSTCYIRWVRGFLSDRKPSVSWQGSTRRKRTFSEGLPQGSVLAPILWLIYMDDLLDKIPSGTVAFAFLAVIKSHVPGPHIGKSNGRQKKYHATASPILRCLR